MYQEASYKVEKQSFTGKKFGMQSPGMLHQVELRFDMRSRCLLYCLRAVKEAQPDKLLMMLKKTVLTGSPGCGGVQFGKNLWHSTQKMGVGRQHTLQPLDPNARRGLNFKQWEKVQAASSYTSLPGRGGKIWHKSET